MVDIANGAVHASKSSSNTGLLPGGCLGPSKPGVRTNGFFSSATRLRSFAAAANVALTLAAVPPENVAVMARTRPLTRLTGAPRVFFATCWQNNTPGLTGVESKPQENTIRAPLDCALA